MSELAEDPRIGIAKEAISKLRSAIQRQRDRAQRFQVNYAPPDVFKVLTKTELSCVLRHASDIPEDVSELLQSMQRRIARAGKPGRQGAAASGEALALGFDPNSEEEIKRRKAREARFAGSAPSKQLGVDAGDAGALMRALDSSSTGTAGASNTGADDLVERAERAAQALLRAPGEGAGRARRERMLSALDKPLGTGSSSGASSSAAPASAGASSSSSSSGSSAAAGAETDNGAAPKESKPAAGENGSEPESAPSSSSSSSSPHGVASGVEVVEGDAAVVSVSVALGAPAATEGSASDKPEPEAASDALQKARAEGWRQGLDTAGVGMSEEERKARGLALLGGGAPLRDGLLLMAGAYLSAGTGDVHRFLGKHQVKPGGIEWLNGESVVCWFPDEGAAGRAMAALSQPVPVVDGVPRVPPVWREAVRPLVKGKTDRYATKGKRTFVWMRPATEHDSADRTVRTRGAGSHGTRAARGGTRGAAGRGRGGSRRERGRDAAGAGTGRQGRANGREEARQTAGSRSGPGSGSGSGSGSGRGGLSLSERLMLGLEASRPGTAAGASSGGSSSRKRKRGRGFASGDAGGSAAPGPTGGSKAASSPRGRHGSEPADEPSAAKKVRTD